MKRNIDEKYVGYEYTCSYDKQNTYTKHVYIKNNT